MEKLQHALQKARTERAAARLGPSAGASGDTVALGARATVDALWAEIPEARFDPDMLLRNRVVTYDTGRDAGAFDIMRTKVLLQMRKNDWRRLAITSPTAVCGKSTIACNLALGLSRQNDLRTIVIELDLHHPSMARILGLTSRGDITEIISGKIPFADGALRVRDNVAIAMARERTVDPTRVLLSQRLENWLAEIEADYAPDLVLFDMPPLLVSDDTRAFLGKVDCAMIVARAEQTTIGQIDTCEREVAEHTNVLGVILNQTRFMDQDDGYGYGYGYGYGG